MYRSVKILFNRKPSFGDVLLLLFFLIFLHYFTGLAQQWKGEYHPNFIIDLSLKSLPKYSFFSLIRAFIAYGFSLAFTLVYGYIAAKNKTNERLMLPLLDIGQSIPVLGFMPGLVLGLVAIFPNSNFGMELACILLIFTGQVWNMTFSFYASLRSVPEPFYEMANISNLNWWSRFKQIELPFSAIHLAWNSLMSMAGGWFFLIACESFTLGEKNFRLPGLGSYMAAAIEKNDTGAMIAGVVAMCLVILFTDFLVWRPIIAWTRKFKLEEVQDEVRDTPFLTMLLKESHILRVLRDIFSDIKKYFFKTKIDKVETKIEEYPLREIKPKVAITGYHEPGKWLIRFKKFSINLIYGLTALLLFWASTRIWELIRVLHITDWQLILKGTLFTFFRVVAALILGSIWTIPFGIWVGLSPKLTRFFQPIIQLAASFPAPMIYPIALVIFSKIGIDLGISSAFLMLLGVQWYILFNVLAGAVGISKEIRESFDLAGVDKKFRWKTLYLPSIFPALVTGWITAAGGAWNASIVAEYILYNGKLIIAPGLGSLISEATTSGNYPFLGGCLIVMVVTVVTINRTFWRPIQRIAETRFRFER
jgi:NitT/TauT family transport system permease protein